MGKEFSFILCFVAELQQDDELLDQLFDWLSDSDWSMSIEKSPTESLWKIIHLQMLPYSFLTFQQNIQLPDHWYDSLPDKEFQSSSQEKHWESSTIKFQCYLISLQDIGKWFCSSIANLIFCKVQCRQCLNISIKVAAEEIHSFLLGFLQEPGRDVVLLVLLFRCELDLTWSESERNEYSSMKEHKDRDLTLFTRKASARYFAPSSPILL